MSTLTIIICARSSSNVCFSATPLITSRTENFARWQTLNGEGTWDFTFTTSVSGMCICNVGNSWHGSHRYSAEMVLCFYVCPPVIWPRSPLKIVSSSVYSLSSSFPLHCYSHFYVGSMFHDIRPHVARSYTSSIDGPFSLISSCSLSNHLLLGLPLFHFHLQLFTC